MRNKLNKLLNNSYSPYSNYKVCAIVVTNDNKEFFGVNIENASYGATICAERVAIFNAISSGYRKNDFKELHIASSGKPPLPCMLCRQVFTEFFTKDTKIFIYTDEVKEYKYTDFCINEFGGIQWEVDSFQ